MTTAFAFDVSAEEFDAAVLKASYEVPVIVDFWAPWCGPCQVLKPMLESLAQEYAGKFRLAKVNSDDELSLARRFGVRGIPHVVAFRAGKPVAQFTGALPEGQLRQFLDRLIPTPSDEAMMLAEQLLAGGDVERAIETLHDVLALNPAHADARFKLIELALDGADIDAADNQLELLDAVARLDERYEPLRARLAALRDSQGGPSEDVLLTRIARRPDDLEARLLLAQRHIANRRFDTALEHLLEIVRRDRGFQNDIGRVTMLNVFQMAAADEPDLVANYRRLLASSLN